ncbi:MAG: ribonuclease J [Chloroflexi bacterium]|nr:ribonuclease J [Chloroflexota bacterium]
MSQRLLRLIPLGGLGEIGKNMMVIDTGRDLIAVDCGVQFPEEEMLGIDLVIPDISYLVTHRDRLRAILITHGHEDHIGALPYVLPKLRGVPIWATRLALGLIRVRLREHRLLEEANLAEYRPGDRIRLGELEVEPFRVNHSIPDSVGLAIRTPLGTVIHTGDFKFDHTPVDGVPADFARLARFGDEGVLALLSDSTYAERPGYTPSEQRVSAALLNIFHEAPGRVIIATFASLIARIQQVIDAAVRTNRKVAIIGRSMEQNAQIALELGYLSAPPGVLIRPEEVNRYSGREIAILTTGSQGEPMSSLARMASGEHRLLSVVPGDTIILSATPIPGNETLINRTIDNLFKQGAEVLYSRVSEVHIQGHASQEELKMMLNLTRPRYFVPIHGEYRMLVQHAKLGQAVGLPDEQIFILEDGEVLEITEHGATVVDRVPVSEVYVDGLGVGDVTSVILRDRRQLASDGIVVVVFQVDHRTAQLVDEPDIFTRGFVYSGNLPVLIERARHAIVEELRHEYAPHLAEWKVVTDQVREALARFIWDQTRQRPMILPIVVEV